MVYQPIVDVTKMKLLDMKLWQEIPENIKPEVIFSNAAKCGLVRNLDTLCIYNAIENAPNGKLVFVNVLPLPWPG